MTDFIDECRRQWKRLGVSDTAADEMAAELLADLQEAELEGATIHDVLGGAATDADAFATAWATERGLTGPATISGRLLRRKAAASLVVIAMVGISLAVAFAVTRPMNSASPNPLAMPYLSTPTGTTFVKMRDLLGMRPIDAVDRGRSLGLNVFVVRSHGCACSADVVVQQWPEAGVRVLRGKDIYIVSGKPGTRLTWRPAA